MIQLTETAVSEFQRLMKDQGTPEAFVRIGVESGGCSGLQYTMDFATAATDADAVFEQPGGVKVVVDRASLASIDGLTVDFSTKLMGGGFRFQNPNAARSCGCGTSFKL
ncbi:MAG: iron-sulfur cluster assembly accessory protein [Candidatus Krumholzibacteriia bacterium]